MTLPFIISDVNQALVYLVNCLTPLRLHVDMLRYFAIKDCVELGCPPDSAAAKDYLPWGYTGLLLFLSKLGILKSFVIVAINWCTTSSRHFLYVASSFLMLLLFQMIFFIFLPVAVPAEWRAQNLRRGRSERVLQDR